ncbi:hypothetical protein AC629_15265 [Bradyrhizobium sp. NAS80.1]|uniref:hypothetical protein n=1 Tax=Bradyrhizobium sp. NAS80.1 TaxID=1680159 RepID=UPI00095F754C|nr:hypothetical protein [Bradyrhizobium sp. NAS80.1]OKO86945.1 hypothetical protein AC629_15265 [Bradyrhizobium sp. NAS80.1]
MTIPPGKTSVALIPFNVVDGFGLVIVNVSCDVPLTGIRFGEKALLIDGGDCANAGSANAPAESVVAIAAISVLRAET